MAAAFAVPDFDEYQRVSIAGNQVYFSGAALKIELKVPETVLLQVVHGERLKVSAFVDGREAR